MLTVQTPQITTFTRYLIAVWGTAVFSGLLMVAAYSNSPGPRQDDATVWPTKTTIQQSDSSLTVVLFAHPKCPCSISTLRELGRGFGQTGESAAVKIGLYCPSEAEDSWTKTKLCSLVEQTFPGSCFVDRNGAEAKRFGAATSGHVFVFAVNGDCLFSGGITSARGHEGDNLGMQAVRSILAGESPPCRSTPVFGCQIAAITQQ